MTVALAERPTDICDADLVQQYRDGNADAVGRLCERHRDRIAATANRLGSPDVDEAVSDVWLALVESAGSFSGRAAFTTWLHQVVANVVRAQIRRRVRADVELVAEIDDAMLPAAVEHGYAAVDNADELSAALDSITDEHRLVVALVDVADVSVAEAARQLGTPVGTVKSRHHRGLAALRGYLTSSHVARPARRRSARPRPTPAASTTPATRRPVVALAALEQAAADRLARSFTTVGDLTRRAGRQLNRRLRRALNLGRKPVTAVVELAPQQAHITEPGRYDDISEEAYHRDPVAGGSLSSTGARLLATRTPAHFDYQRRNPRQPKREFDLGTATHTLALGRGAELEFLEFEHYRTKAAQQARDEARAAGKTPLTVPEQAQVRRMLAAVHAHPVVGTTLDRRDGRAEVTFVGVDPETGVTCRCRVDWLLPIEPGKPIRYADLKTLSDASRAGLSKSMNEWNYHSQRDFYDDTIRWALGLPPDYPVIGVLFGVEKEPPHLVGYGEPDEQSVTWAHEDNRKARHRYARCTERGYWPGHDDENVDGAPVPLSLPGWRLNAYENQYPTGEFLPPVDTTTTFEIEEFL